MGAPNWYAPEGVKPEYVYSFSRQNWFDHSAAEHRAVRENIGLFDQTSFAKFRLQGPGAEEVLNQVSANDVAVEPGRIVYTQWLNERGGIEADLTVTREAEDRYLIVTGAASQVRDFHWLARHIPEGLDAQLTDVTETLAVLGVMGPKARDLLQGLTNEDLSNGAFPFGASREIETGGGKIRASRISYVGELGWELYIPTKAATGVFDAVAQAGEAHGLAPAGMHAICLLYTSPSPRD